MKDSKPTRSYEQISAGLMEELKRKCYGSETIDNYRRALSRIGKFMEREGICTYTGEVGEAFIAEFISVSCASESHIRFTKTAVRRLNDTNEGIAYRLAVPKPMPPLPARFSEPTESYLLHCSNLGNKANTVTKKRNTCSKFLCHLYDLGCPSILEINTEYICKAIIRQANKDAYAIIRAFLRYLHEIKALRFNYSGIIPKYSRGKILPTTYSTGEVRRLEETINRSSKAGKRDYAALLLVTRLGLRSGDVAGLTFEDIDFHRNTINITQEKTNLPLTLPLLPEIKAALEDYIQLARPNICSKQIFLGANAPFCKMTTSTMRRALKECFLAAGINISGKKHGPHSLRSSLASSMVNGGESYEVVRRLLGHNDPNAIKHYAKIDVENLRCYAIDIPPPSGMFDDLLDGRM